MWANSESRPGELLSHLSTRSHDLGRITASTSTQDKEALSTWSLVINLKIEIERKIVQGTLSSSEIHAIRTWITFSICRLSPSETSWRQEDYTDPMSPKVSVGLKSIICKQIDALQKEKKLSGLSFDSKSTKWSIKVIIVLEYKA